MELARILAVSVRSGVRENWRELRAIEEQVESIAEDFDGEDPLHERVRANFDEAKSILVDLHERVPKYTGPFHMLDPDEELREMVKQIIDNEVKHLRMR